MKKLIYTSVLLLAATLTACNDFLTVESPDKLPSEKFWRDEADAESGLAAVYSKLENFLGVSDFPGVRWPVEAFREDMIETGTDVLNYPVRLDLARFTYTNGNPQMCGYWANLYNGINYANQVIEKVPKIDTKNIDEEYRTQIVNEAYFLRGYYHMKLILNWEKIIIRDTYVVTASADELGKALSTRQEAWKLIMEDFQKATALPEKQTAERMGRATCGAAYAYIGFAALMQASEEAEKKTELLNTALNAFNQVKGYSLVKEFRTMFDGRNENSTESIFELQFSMNSENGADYKNKLHIWIASSELGGYDEILPSDKLVAEFKKEGKTAKNGLYDKRIYETLYFEDEYYNGAGEDVWGSTYDKTFGKGGRTVFRKMLPPTLEEFKGSRIAYNIPLMRYANVLLMKAEVHNELGHPELAIPLINEVRDTHGNMPPMKGTSQQDVRDQIEHERVLEFPLENLRFYDMRRWGIAKKVLHDMGRTNFDPDKHSFYPIPLTELNSNDKL